MMTSLDALAAAYKRFTLSTLKVWHLSALVPARLKGTPMSMLVALASATLSPWAIAVVDPPTLRTSLLAWLAQSVTELQRVLAVATW